MHVLVPGEWTVLAGHDVVEEIEQAVMAEFEGCQVTIHLEPREDPRAYGDYDHEVIVRTD
jgi:divalent metal cation (Fe/Co/Zn/Cd) transporter